MSKVNILGVDFDNKTFNQFQNEFINRLNNHLSTFIVTANPEIVMAANEVVKEAAFGFPFNI